MATETIAKADIIAEITSIIESMDILDNESMQHDGHGIDFYCMAALTRNSLRELADTLNRCELCEDKDGASELGEAVADTLRHELEANLANALAPAFGELRASIREEVAGKYRDGIGRAFDALSKASRCLTELMSDGEADMRETDALMHVTSAMLELLSLQVRA